jgi:hypothetical protein
LFSSPIDHPEDQELIPGGDQLLDIERTAEGGAHGELAAVGQNGASNESRDSIQPQSFKRNKAKKFSNKILIFGVDQETHIELMALECMKTDVIDEIMYRTEHG